MQRQTRIWNHVDRPVFEAEILAAHQPAILKGLVADWPLVVAARRSPAELCAYLTAFDCGLPIQAFLGAPELRGRYFYNDDLTGLNFQERQMHISALLGHLLEYSELQCPPSLYAGSVSIPKFLPGLEIGNPNALLDSLVAPNAWIGNRSRIGAHFDIAQNIACVVSGRRRFTLFPTEQLRNLYVGPMELTPAGRSMSLVDFSNPDFDKFPRFREALASSEVAELGPGDALYIPTLWWHHVESLDPISMLVNYWWNAPRAQPDSPVDSLLHCLLSVRHLPACERKAWRAIFDYYIFQTDEEPMAHVAADKRGMFAPQLPEDAARRLRNHLLNSLNQ